MALNWASPRAILEKQRDGEREGQNKGRSKEVKEKEVRKELKRKEEEQRKGKKRREKNKAQHGQTYDDRGRGDQQVSQPRFLLEGQEDGWTGQDHTKKKTMTSH